MNYNAINYSTESTRTCNRAHKRRKCDIGALILLEGAGEIPCTIADISVSGARLIVQEDVLVPRNFKLSGPSKAFDPEVELVWRRQNELGVRFV